MKKILLIGFGLFIAIQFIPYGRDHTNPPVVAQVQWDTQETQALFQRACADCHSNETKWPWYSNIAPLSWSIYHHVDEGREHFNVSMWGVQKKNKGDEAAEEVEEGEMPLASYLIAHPEARLTKEEKQALIAGLKNTFGNEKYETHKNDKD
ncbi:heme-binding domain-containing protein [Sulfurimonas hydrogeniphila]|uniref:heme-binding domain-containing protein n=1 Tax=Sulfurimonas hydrogeniphila TaxID=2509341 RepID=UPI00125EEF79|nr:heme-binding domain-containing protein [Sulfurimonas hydrogeniphila]